VLAPGDGVRDVVGDAGGGPHHQEGREEVGPDPPDPPPPGKPPTREAGGPWGFPG